MLQTKIGKVIRTPNLNHACSWQFYKKMFLLQKSLHLQGVSNFQFKEQVKGKHCRPRVKDIDKPVIYTSWPLVENCSR